MKRNESFKRNNLIFKEDQVEGVSKKIAFEQHFVVPWELMENETEKSTITHRNGQFVSDWCFQNPSQNPLASSFSAKPKIDFFS